MAESVTESDNFAELTVIDPESQALLGCFDVPAFARRGADLEALIALLHQRCRRERDGMLAMVRLRLRQWGTVAVGPDDYDPFLAPVDPLRRLTGLDAPTGWAEVPGSARRRKSVAVDLAASVGRFNRRWLEFLNGLDLDRINGAIDGYNRYYLIEKECRLGSTRLAARHYQPYPSLTPGAIQTHYPTLPVPTLRGRTRRTLGALGIWPANGSALSLERSANQDSSTRGPS